MQLGCAGGHRPYPRSRCQTHRFRWRLSDEFFGVGTYKVAVTVWDRDAQFSKTVARTNTTLD